MGELRGFYFTVFFPDLEELLHFMSCFDEMDLFHLLNQVLGVFGLTFRKLGKFFTRMLKVRITLGILVLRPNVRDFTSAAGIHSLLSSKLKPVQGKQIFKMKIMSPFLTSFTLPV